MSILKSNRGYDPTFCLMDECAYMNDAAVASAMTYATNRGVTIMLLCSPVDASHWLSRLEEVTEGDERGVCLISLRFLCDACSRKGTTGICVHGSLQLPWHIDTGGDLHSDPVRQVMEMVLPGTYQQEICGFTSHTKGKETQVFGQNMLSRLMRENNITLGIKDQKEADAVFVSLDPVQAGSSVSGIGLAVVVVIGEIYVVSFFP